MPTTAPSKRPTPATNTPSSNDEPTPILIPMQQTSTTPSHETSTSHSVHVIPNISTMQGTPETCTFQQYSDIEYDIDKTTLFQDQEPLMNLHLLHNLFIDIQ